VRPWVQADYSTAAVGVGRAQRDAAAVAGRMAAGKQDDAIEKFDEGLTKLERFETALGRGALPSTSQLKVSTFLWHTLRGCRAISDETDSG
jgi:hypothetical protein